MFRLLAPWILALSVGSAARANTIIETTWNPTRSRQGEPIRFTIRVKTRGSELIRSPEFPTVLVDWDLIRVSLNPSMRTVMENGQFVATQDNEYSYILAPRRKGTLAVPSVVVAVGPKRYRSQEAKIQVDDVPLGSNSWNQDQDQAPMPMPVPKSARPSFPDPNSPWGPGVPGLPRDEDIFQEQPSPGDTYNFEIPGEGRQTFFVKAHVKKTTAFVGEMIEVSYRAYTKSINLREPEITKFPEFKGFLKEDLYFPKMFDPQPVIIQGQSFFETELIRYALYPLREGKLSVDAMNFKLRISSVDSLADSILRGTPFDGAGGTQIPMEKGSPSIGVLVKPLPVPKPESFTGAVGKFRLEALLPQSSIQAAQPFSLIVNIDGVGNLKAIEAPKLLLPKEIDITNIATHPSSLSEDGSGTIQFEYLLTPNQAGTVQIAESEWSYFDPEKVEYVKLKIPAATLTITKGANSSTPGGTESSVKPEAKREWLWPLGKTPSSTERKFSEIGEPSLVGSHTAFGLHLVALSYFLGALWNRRRKEDRDVYLKTYPWTHLEEEFARNQKIPAQKLAEKLDLWTRLRLIGYFKSVTIEHSLHSESARGEFTEILKQNLPPDFHQSIDQLKSYWSELDSMRFSGTAATTEMAVKAPFEKARATLSQIEKTLRKSEKHLHRGFQDEWSN